MSGLEVSMGDVVKGRDRNGGSFDGEVVGFLSERLMYVDCALWNSRYGLASSRRICAVADILSIARAAAGGRKPDVRTPGVADGERVRRWRSATWVRHLIKVERLGTVELERTTRITADALDRIARDGGVARLSDDSWSRVVNAHERWSDAVREHVLAPRPDRGVATGRECETGRGRTVGGVSTGSRS